MGEEYSYQAKGTMQTCPYSNEPAIVVSDGADISKSQCRYSDECPILLCPLEQELRYF